MSNKIEKKKTGWGGRRERSGAKPREGGTVKKTVSVTQTVWQDAVKKWNGQASRLIDVLLRKYVTEGGCQ
jgi:hypothetical protein